MKNVPDQIERARTLLERGNEGRALRVLSGTVYATHDPRLLAEIERLARDGWRQAPPQHRPGWHNVELDCEVRIAYARADEAAAPLH